MSFQQYIINQVNAIGGSKERTRKNAISRQVLELSEQQTPKLFAISMIAARGCVYHSRRAVVAGFTNRSLIETDESLRLVELSYRHLWIQLRCDCGLQSETPESGYLSPENYAQLFVFAYCNRIKGWQDEYERATQLYFEKKRSQDEFFQEPTSALAAFAYVLDQTANNPAFMDSVPRHWELDAYREIVNHWHESDDALKKAILRICELHEACLFDGDRFHILNSVLGELPISIFPYDILMIYEVRNRLGLTTPDVEHPILGFSPAEHKPRFYDATDEWVPQLEAALERAINPEARIGFQQSYRAKFQEWWSKKFNT